MRFLDTEHKRKSMVITVVLHVLLILSFFLVGMKYLDPPLEAGIAVNFGTSDEGMGNVQPTEQVESAPQQHTAPASKTEADLEEDVVTQEVEDAPVVEDKKDKKESVETSMPEKPVETKKTDPKPDQATTDALSSILGPSRDGKSPEGDGNDGVAGDKGDPEGDPHASSYYGSGKGLDGDGNYQLGGRRALNKEKIVQKCNESGTVVVSIEVDRNGKVIKATPGVRGSTSTAACLMEPARNSALATRFNPDDKAPARQVGKIIYRFSLSE